MRFTIRYSSGAHDHREWAHRGGAERAKQRLVRCYPRLGAITVVPVPGPDTPPDVNVRRPMFPRGY